MALLALDMSLRLNMDLSLAPPQSAQQLALMAALAVGFLASLYVFDFYNIRVYSRGRRFATFNA
ncbi:MAG TPA: hypothetical protein PLP83_08855 [Candidatus Aminicenantes bacterium]|nr:hypothetical protein [Candidatus Aminicenantes bacterium]